jgi:RNA polymerase sigma-70 factor, ECF subfamily
MRSSHEGKRQALMATHESDDDRRRDDFVRLFQQHERGVYGYILSLVPNLVAADEISQNTNLLLWKEFDRFDASKDFGVWARSIAHYEVLTYRKTHARERMRFDSELLEALADRASQRDEQLASRQSHLMDCLSQLSDFKRQAMQLYYFFGMTAKAVAEKLGRNASVVEKTITRTRRTLYDCIEGAVHREDGKP